MLLNGGGWGHQVGMAAQLRERGYLLDGRGRSEVAKRSSSARRAPRSRAGVLRLAIAGLAVLARAIGDRG